MAAVAGCGPYHRREEILAASGLELPQVAALVWELSVATCARRGSHYWRCLAIVDYGYQRWHYDELRMTPQEVREEMRNLQGDPQTAARRRSVQRQLALDRLASRWPGPTW